MAKSQIQKILVPMDGSKNSFRGLDTAIYLARQFDATITGLYVVPVYPSFTVAGLTGSFRSKMTKYAQKFLSDAKTKAAQSGVMFHEKIVSGIAMDYVASYANTGNFDLIVLVHRVHSSAWEMFFGSVVNATVHRSKIPIFVVK